MQYVFKSRKFWAAIVGIGFVILESFVPDFPIGEADILKIVLLLASYIFGVAIDDGLNQRG